MIDTAMILAAGRGTRMQAAPNDPPKPLTEIAGQNLLARMMQRLEKAGIRRIVINMHHKAEAIEAFAAAYDGAARIILSDERDALLETGGGVKKALRHFAEAPFLVANGDVLWCEESDQIANFIGQFDADKMTACLLLAARERATGYDGTGDYLLLEAGRLARKTGTDAPYIFAGVQILTPGLFAAMPDGAFSLNLVYDAAQAQGGLYGHVLDGLWMHVGTPQGRQAAEAALKE